MLVGRLRGATPLGFYTRALNLTSLPMYYMSTSLSRVIYPSMSRVQADQARMRGAYLSVLTFFAGFGLPIVLGMSGAAREIITVLYGGKWADSIPVMRVVAIAAGLAMLSHFGGIVLEACARLKEKLMMRLGQLVLFGAALFAFARFGLVGFAVAFVLSETVFHAAVAWRVAVLAGISARRLGQAYWPGGVGGIVLCACAYGESLLGTWVAMPVLGVLAVQIVTGVVVMALVILRLGHGRLFSVLDERVRPTLKRRFPKRLFALAASLSASAPKTGVPAQ
jgi:lipopolysaccharide exporter